MRARQSMGKTVSPLYEKPLADLDHMFARTIAKGIDSSPHKRIAVYFRADDIGVPSKQFMWLSRLFKEQQTPLSMAVVPSWTSKKRMTFILQQTGKESSQWCWHQHGRTHKNFESTGRKQEFGSARPYHAIKENILLGQDRLQHLLSDQFCPVFTPPWNRCSEDAIRALAELGFLAISRTKGALPQSTPLLPDIPVHVDLHTRKETVMHDALASLLRELEAGLKSGFCGIMIHHQRMNLRAVGFLESLIRQMQKRKEIDLLHFGDLLPRRR